MHMPYRLQENVHRSIDNHTMVMVKVSVICMGALLPPAGWPVTNDTPTLGEKS
jgi:hypothetical protein